jgi:hypothetical protein
LKHNDLPETGVSRPGGQGEIACYNVGGMKKPEIAKGLAEASGMTEAEAADRLDRVVNDIIARLRRGERAPLPGLGSFSSKRGGKISFRRERGRRG